MRATKESALMAPKKNGVWDAPVDLVDTEGEAVSAADGRQLMVVRLGIRKKTLLEASPFNLAQVSVVCKPRNGADSAVGGSGEAVYPLGYLMTPQSMDRKSPLAEIKIDSKKVKESPQWIDFVFPVPRDMVPVLGRFKINSAVLLSSPVGVEDAPEPSDFGSQVEPKPARAPAESEADSAEGQ